GYPGSPSTPASSSTPKRILVLTAASRSKAMRAASAAARATRWSRSPRRSVPRSPRMISTICSAPHAPDKAMSKKSSPEAHTFYVDTRFQRLARRPGGVPREQALEGAQANIDESKPEFEIWLDAELQNLAAVVR